MRPGTTAGKTRGAFIPGAASIDVHFVRGDDGLSSLPLVVERAELRERFAIVQETYVEGCEDMYFDEALWRALAGFVVATGGEVTTIEHGRRAGEIPLDQFLEIMTRTDPENREPPGAVLARMDGELVLAMVTDFWVYSGGPTPYHDSYTYAVFSHRDVSSEVMRALEDAEAFQRWRLGAVSDVPASRGRRSRAAPGPITSFFAAFLLSLRGR